MAESSAFKLLIKSATVEVCGGRVKRHNSLFVGRDTVITGTPLSYTSSSAVLEGRKKIRSQKNLHDQARHSMGSEGGVAIPQNLSIIT